MEFFESISHSVPSIFVCSGATRNREKPLPLRGILRSAFYLRCTAGHDGLHRNTLARPRGDIMAPIVTSRSKIDSNNNSAESNNRPSARASTLSREKPRSSSSSSSSIGVKTRGLTSEKKEPAGPERTTKPSSASSSTSSSRAQRAVPNKSSKELPTAARKDVKTPPSSAGAPAHAKEEKAVKLHPLPSAQLTKHKQAAVFTSGKKKHKRWVNPEVRML